MNRLRRWPRAALLATAAALLLSSFARGQVPGQVTGVTFGIDLQTITWDGDPAATAYNVYHGNLADLAQGFSCLCHGAPCRVSEPGAPRRCRGPRRS